MNENTGIEIETRSEVEAYPNHDETDIDAIMRGAYQTVTSAIIRWRTYELDDDGNAIKHGTWHEQPRPH